MVRVTQEFRSSVHGGGVKVVHVSDGGIFAAAGITIHRLRASLVDAFTLPAAAISFVNGE